ncbi:MAG TPA: FliH/SctL family protein [Bacteroidota bacterium]|nr:FliH/SctL family protein [Bacteroidota bacterium]
MNEIVIKVPRHRKKIEIIRSKEELDNALKIRKQESSIKSSSKKKETTSEKSQSPQYTQIFKITNLDTPTQIEYFAPETAQINWDSIEAEIEDAYDRGYREGQDTARTVFNREIARMYEANRIVDTLIESFKREFQKEIQNLKHSLIDLSLIIAEQIIRYEVSKNDEFILNQIQNIINELDNEIIYKIVLNPKDIAILEESKSKFVGDSSKIENVKIVANEEIEQGFCIIETNIGEFDGRLKTQLEKLRQAMISEIKNVNVIDEINERRDKGEIQ